MPRIGILTCSNCTRELDCASVVCLADMRKKKGFFERYQTDDPLVLVGLISCAGCPTLGASEKILRKVNALAAFKVDAIHLSYCMTALCPFKNKYVSAIKEAYPDIEIVEGTHTPRDFSEFREEVKAALCVPTPNMTEIIKARREKKAASGLQP
jgi:predicted metal-binding protein